MSIEALKTEFTNLQPQIAALKGQLKALNAHQKALRNDIHDYMTNNGLTELMVGSLQFSIAPKTRVKFTKDDFKALLPNEEALANYQITEDRLSVRKPKRVRTT